MQAEPVKTHDPRVRPARPAAVTGIAGRGKHLLHCAIRVARGALLGAVTLAAWGAEGGEPLVRLEPLTVPGADPPGFTLLAPAQTGIFFTNWLPPSRHLTNQILPNGSGVAAGDVDGDGWCDVYFCGLKDTDNRLYRNLGHWRFADVTAAAGVACSGLDATGAVFADLDGDGDLDLIVNTLGSGTLLFFNDGRGRFTPAPAPLNPNRGGTSLALADADGDGRLDLYVANYRVWTLTDAPGTRFGVKRIEGQPVVTLVNGRPLTDPEWTNRFRFTIELGPGGQGRFAHEELGEADVFYHNLGQGRFAPVPFTSGVFLDEDGRPLAQPLFDWGLAVLFRDLNGDGAPDLYVCNDFSTPDRLWWNDGRGKFRLAPRTALRQTSLASMAVAAGDLDRDGHDDLVVLDMLGWSHERRLTQRNILRAELAPAGDLNARPQSPRNTVLWNRGDGTYAEIAQYAGLEGTDWSWNPLLLDVDLDGYEDLLVVNGFVRDNMNLDAMNRIAAAKAGRRLTPAEDLQLRALYPPLETPNLAFRNLGCLRFAAASRAWGFDQAGISQGACLADLDNDGDLDVIVNNLNAAAAIYRNNAPAPRLAVRLKGAPPNTGGIGARITVTGGPVTQTQEVVAGGRYCSADAAHFAFAAGAASSLAVHVRWRSGRETAVSNVPPNHRVEITEPTDSPVSPSLGRSTPSSPDGPRLKFADETGLLGHLHEDALFDDFARQPLLFHQLSQLGPAVAWWDVTGDGREELIIGTGRGGRLAVLRRTDEGRWTPAEGAWSGEPVSRDTAGLAGLVPGELLIAWSNYEDGQTNGPGLVGLGSRATIALAPLQPGAFGPVAVGDYDGDGRLDVFAGIRTVGGRYPESGRSLLLRQTDQGFSADAANAAGLPDAPVTGAIWSDLTGDGWPELVLACDWGPVRLYRNEGGRLRPWNPGISGAAIRAPHRDPGRRDDEAPLIRQPATLNDLSGWWNGLAVGDFDGDGRLDLVVANWGSNSRFERWRPAPLRVDYGDLNEDGSVELLESRYVPELGTYAPGRMLDTVTRVLPRLGVRFPTHAAWARAGMEDVLAEWPGATRRLEVNWLETTLFLNRGDSFEVRVLPREAQVAPAFAVCVGDADGDGHEDVFLSQNFFGVELDTSRYDAGLGLWLRGDGRGGFTATRGHETGVRIFGEQRGAALADYDADGRVDLVVSQNRAATRLFRNIGARPGLRVHLEGAPGNPATIGAVARLRFGDSSGPAREIRAGSGWWSQDSPVLLMATPTPPTAIQVRWPGGRVTEAAVPAGARAITVRLNGDVTVAPR